MIFDLFLKPVIYVTLVEFVLVILLVLLIFVFYVFIDRNKKKQDLLKKEFSNNLLKYIQEKKEFSSEIIPKKCSIYMILAVVENFEAKFSFEEWNRLKEAIVDKYLMSFAYKWFDHWFWLKRNFSARCFAALPRNDQAKYIASLLQDKVAIVRLIAARAAARLGSHFLIRAMIKAMAKETEKGRYAYIDSILKGDIAVFNWIAAQLKTEKDELYRYIYLDILSRKFFYKLSVEDIRYDLASLDNNLRLMAVKAFCSFPSKENTELFLAFLKDPYYFIRAEAARALPLFLGDESIKYLEEMLTDDIWWVRLQAALTLKGMKQKGIEVLLRQDEQERPRAYNVAQYVLPLPEI